MRLSKLFRMTPVKHSHFIGGEDHIADSIGTGVGIDPEIRSIHYRSQDVRPGGLFVALRGLSADGHDFIGDALARGAVAVVTRNPFDIPDDLRKARSGSESVHQGFCHMEVADTRKTLAGIAACFFDNPSDRLILIGITGTNGKTTTARLIESLLSTAGFDPGVIGTLNYRFAGNVYENPMTTPEAPDLQRILADMCASGVSHVVMEVSSHGIDRHRVDNCHFDVGVFTNLTQDHLDYHGNMESYWSCKRKWFTENLSSGPKRDRVVTVVNCDQSKGRELAGMLSGDPIHHHVVTVGHSPDNQIRPENITFDMTGISGLLSVPEGSLELGSSLVGKHNLENILCAIGVGVALHLPLKILRDGIESISSVPGRLESVANDRHRFVYVDYAHTPDALERVLLTLKELSSGRIICIFGCGGNRDRNKRSQMGEIAVKYCDLSIITSDNPRLEDPIRIISDICEGADKTSPHRYDPDDLETGFMEEGYVVVPDRKQAIVLGLVVSVPGDTILIAGKGNETYQIIGERILPFDDRKEARRALSSTQMSSIFVNGVERLDAFDNG